MATSIAVGKFNGLVQMIHRFNRQSKVEKFLRIFLFACQGARNITKGFLGTLVCKNNTSFFLQCLSDFGKQGIELGCMNN